MKSVINLSDFIEDIFELMLIDNLSIQSKWSITTFIRRRENLSQVNIRWGLLCSLSHICAAVNRFLTFDVEANLLTLVKLKDIIANYIKWREVYLFRLLHIDALSILMVFVVERLYIRAYIITLTPEFGSSGPPLNCRFVRLNIQLTGRI